ncbi:MAG: GNAT family N-acetyltransferase [Rhodothalassiaceae bacterium]
MTNRRERLVLRPAKPDDAALLADWDRLPHVRAASGGDFYEDWQTELARVLPWRDWRIAEVDGRSIGAVQIIDPAQEETHYWGDVPAGLRAIDLWIGPADALGRGYGTLMMQQALDVCFQDPQVIPVLVDPMAANLRAHRFYQRLGFQDQGPRRFGEDDCRVFRLDRAVWAV